uniref:Uncharacterized protein n=1 Tax=Mycena chlorophos TaxID=658473 RepID=A0ABQ0MDH3_MYCCL|nr:predicted protein [Mycena chlorophos]
MGCCGSGATFCRHSGLDVGVGERSAVVEVVYGSFERERAQEDWGRLHVRAVPTQTNTAPRAKARSRAHPAICHVSGAWRRLDHHPFAARNLRRSTFLHCIAAHSPQNTLRRFHILPSPMPVQAPLAPSLAALRTAYPSACCAHGCAAGAPIACAPTTAVECANLHLALVSVGSSHDPTTPANDTTPRTYFRRRMSRSGAPPA